jgi:threonine/homoserine/homoserine lactone efflux protein
LAVIGTSMGVGRRSGIALALGVAAGSFCWAMLTVVGLSALIASYAAALKAIKIAGGAYLLWLAYKAFRSAASAHDLEATVLAGATRSPVGYFTRGFTIQMTNPKAALAWIAIISLGLREDAPLWVGFSIVARTVTLSVIIHCQATLGALFAFAGIKLLTSRSEVEASRSRPYLKRISARSRYRPSRCG